MSYSASMERGSDAVCSCNCSSCIHVWYLLALQSVEMRLCVLTTIADPCFLPWNMMSLVGNQKQLASPHN